jgi:outer membrane receptor protein involved in Fe transport
MHRENGLASRIAAMLLMLVFSAASAVERGEPLVDALNELRGRGLQLIFSSALIEPQLIVDVDPGTGTPEQIARRILESHGLTLEAIRPGLFSIVKRAVPAVAAPASDDELAENRFPSPEYPLYEVKVYASRYAIDRQQATSLVELSRDDLEGMAGVSQDALRVTRFLPGTTSNTLSARSHVRGGREDELGIYFDGVPLPEPFHFKDVQSVLGILDPDAVSTVEFYSGVFPARYGNRLSGVLDMQPRQWQGENYNAIGASNLYFSALSQVRLERLPLEWLASVRYGNRSLLRDLLHFRQQESEPSFLDALGRVKLDLGSRSDVALGWLLVQDEMEARLDGGASADLGYRDATGWVSWEFRPDANKALRATLSRTERHTDRGGALQAPGGELSALDDRRRFDTTNARLEATARANDMLSLNAGIEWQDDDAAYLYQADAQFDPAFAAAFDRATSFSRHEDFAIEATSYAAYASALLSLGSRTVIDLGLRWDGQRFGDAFRDDEVSPRVSFQFRYDPRTVLRASWGRLAQTERADELLVPDGDESFHPAQRATQSVLSIERRAFSSVLLRAEAYEKRVSSPRPIYENVLDPFSLLPELGVDRVRVQPDKSHAYGIELSFRWEPGGAWSGWANYNWSEATDEIDGRTVPRTWDQRNALSSGIAWAREPWLLSGTFTWHSGWRRNELLLEGADLVLSQRNERSWPDQLSLDLRAAWRRPLRRGELELFGEITNATDHDNLCCDVFQFSASPPGLNRATSGWLPRVYLFGLTWRLP